MAENKKSFILYADLIHTINKLPDKKAGELFKHILCYVNDQNPKTDDLIINIAFEPIKQQLKRDLINWSDIREKRSLAGKKSAEVKKQKSTKSTSVESVKQTSTKSTVNVNVNDNVTVNDNVINKDNKEDKNIFSKLLNSYPCVGDITATKKEWDNLDEDEKNIIIKHSEDYHKEMLKYDAIGFMPNFDKYIRGKMFTLPISKLVTRYKKVINFTPEMREL